MKLKANLPLAQSIATPIGLLLIISFHLMSLIPYQDVLRTSSFDLYQILMPRERVSAPVVIVEIDEASLQEFGQWPWPRSLLARLVDRINEMKPASLAIDIIMPEPDRSSICNITKHIPNIGAKLTKQACDLPSNDELLANALFNSRAILGIAGMNGKNSRKIKAAPMVTQGEDPRPFIRHFSSALQNIHELDNAAGGHAILSADMERGVIRRIPLIASIGDTVLPSLALESLRLASGSPIFNVKSSADGIESVGVGDLFIPTQSDGSTWIHYSHHDPSRFVSAADILNGKLATDDLNRKLVLVGFSGLGLVDFPSTTLGDRVPGVEIHAQVLETIFDGTTLIRPSWALSIEAILMLVLGLFVFYASTRLKAAFLAPLLLFIIASLIGAALFAFSHAHLLIDVASPLFLFLVLYGTMQADSLIREEAHVKGLEDDLRVQREEAAKTRGEMEAAKRFQMGIVPDAITTFINESRLDIAASMEPAKMVGGDLYDCFMLDEHRVFFSVGDVCGKGVPASLFMVISKTLCKSIALRKETDLLDLGSLVAQANKEISRDNPEMLFVTAFVGVLDLQTGELIYCNAGHERPLICAPGCNPVELSGLGGPPISTIDDWDYETHRYQFSPEEFLCVYSDGVTEAINGKNELFSHERLISTLTHIDKSKSAIEVMEQVLGDVYSFVGNAEPYDDLTIMVVRWQNNNDKLKS